MSEGQLLCLMAAILHTKGHSIEQAVECAVKPRVEAELHGRDLYDAAIMEALRERHAKAETREKTQEEAGKEGG